MKDVFRSACALILLWMLMAWPAPCRADVPNRIAGFALGGRLSDYTEALKMETAMPIRYLESMKEVEIKPVQGFKTGLVYYGTCLGEARIIRIKLKYENASEKFYKELLNKYQNRFGKPNEWKGDPFHAVVAWKWVFRDADNNHIILILQHNTSNEDEKMGNSLKLTLFNLMEAEAACYEKNRDLYRKPYHPKPDRPKTDPDWDLLIPQ